MRFDACPFDYLAKYFGACQFDHLAKYAFWLAKYAYFAPKMS